MESKNVIRISSCNVRGLHEPQKRRDLFCHLRNKNFHIYCLQDTHFTEKMEPYIRSEWGGEIICSSYTSNARGVCILFSNHLEYKIFKTKQDTEGNFILLDIEIEGKRLTLVNIYGPNDDSPEFYLKIGELIEQFNNDTNIICGDFNLVQDQELDTHNYLHINNPKAKECVLSMKEEFNLIDPFRELNEFIKKYTWRKPHPLKQARLDFFLISESFMSSVQNVEILPSYRSDHSLIVMSISLNEFIKGKGLWKFNNSLLKDSEYADIVKRCIKKVKELYMLPVYNIEYVENSNHNNLQFTISDQLFLEMLLIEIRGKTISYAAYKKKQKNLREEQLQEEIKELEESDVLNLTRIELKKNELQAIRKEKLQGIMVRARLRWAEQGEKPTKYFCSLESRNYVNKTISKLIKEDGKIITKQKDILEEVKNFYENLYRYKEPERGININEILNTQNCSTLTDEEKNKLEGDIQDEEIGFVLKNMKNNKSPGSDGFTAEFFKFFFKDIKIFLRRAINDCYRSGSMSVTYRQGLITCIPKGDKSRQYMKNWRPITLLNVVYKIASGCIAERIKRTLSKLISCDQTGFISGRYIGENTRFIYDLLKYTEDENIPGLLLIVDFEKAFDTISWDFIRKVLDFFNFGESIKRWINTFYNNITSTVIQSGFLSDFFSVQRGCRQGDPLSPYVFLLCAEILSLMLKQNDKLNGITIGGTEYRLSQYADDTTVLLDGTEQSLAEALDVLNIFAIISGLKVNTSKTQAVWIGSKKFCGETFNHRFKIDWNQGHFTILGIKFSCNLEEMLDLNFKDKIKQIENELKLWSKRILTPFGRITILKTLIISKLNHLFIALPNPPQIIINGLQKNFFAFIWQSRVDRIKRDLLMQEYDNGGLKMINLQNYVTALKLTWLRRLIMNDSKYKYMFELKYSSLEMLLKRGTEFANSLIATNTNAFWNDVLESWTKLNDQIKIKTTEDILSVNIWDNKEIRINNVSVFYRRWYEKKIYYIKDLFDQNGIFLDFQSFTQSYDLRINYLNYYCVISAIQNYIRKHRITITSSSLFNCILPLTIKEIMSESKGSRRVYKLLNTKIIEPKSQVKWSEIFPYIDLNWSVIYNIPLKSCSNTKLHWFQYRILHRILATNDFLHKIKIKTDSSCTFCKNYPETLEHLFWNCGIISEFWEKIETWINENSDYIVAIVMYNVIFGITFKREFHIPVNYIIILTKYYIYKCRTNNKPLNFSVWKNEIKNSLLIEKMIAIKNNRYQKFAENWDGWLKLFEENDDS